MLKYKADLITLLYIALNTSNFFIHWNMQSFNPLFYAFQLFISSTIFVIAHNHNHVPMWKSKILNRITDYWVTIFYGFPAFVWKPTHNLNHHKLNNRKGDYTITYRFSKKNTLLTLLIYPSISAFYQQKPVKDYLIKMKKTSLSNYYYYLSQYGVLIGALLVAFLLDWQKAFLYLVIPQQFVMFIVLMINYIQHVHADEESRYNHSRNFTGLLNKFLLNNGLHTAHHEQMGLHWSELPKLHTELEPKIEPSLNEKSILLFLFRAYILSLFIPKYRTKPIRLAGNS